MKDAKSVIKSRAYGLVESFLFNLKGGVDH